MITIVIADDEKLIRTGLKIILQENLDIPLEILEAKNGKEALDLCNEKKPDLLITDIRMPIMDGVELMKNLASMQRKQNIIVLSGYDDFQYAKVAIQSGALSYILKPVDKKELIAAVKNAIMEVSKEEKSSNEKKLRQLFENGRLDGKLVLPEIKIKNGLHCISVYGNNAAAVIEQVFEGKNYYVIAQTRNSVCIVYFFEGPKLDIDATPLKDFIIGISSPADDYSMLRKLRNQSIIAAMESFFDVQTGIAYEKDKKIGIYYYNKENSVQSFPEIEDNYEKMIAGCGILDSSEIQKNVNKLFAPFYSNEKQEKSEKENSIGANLSAKKLFYLYKRITSNMFSRFFNSVESDIYLHMKGIMLENIFECEKLLDWKTAICDYVVYVSALLKQNTKQSPYITEALEYIKTHFTKNINMAIVANQVSVNYTWFSEKFKEHTGMNFNEYLKGLRIEESKKLLEKGCYKVYEVAERSGFSDVKYFMKQFREETGLSPTEWSNQHKMKNL